MTSTTQAQSQTMQHKNIQTSLLHTSYDLSGFTGSTNDWKKFSQFLLSSQDDPNVRFVILFCKNTLHEDIQIDEGRRVISLIQESPKPVIGVLEGAVNGIGAEVLLACHYRIGATSQETYFSLDSISLGLIPYLGSTQRLPRIIGLTQALPVLLETKKIRPQKAKEVGLIHQLIEPPTLLDEAIHVGKRISENKMSPRSQSIKWTDRLIMLPLLSSFVLKKVRDQVNRATRGHYPAPIDILDCIETGLIFGEKGGLEKEKEKLSKLLKSKTTQNLSWLNRAQTQLKTESNQPIPFKKIAVIGSGLMGEGITSVSLPLSTVVLNDISKEHLDKASSKIASSLDQRVRKRVLSSQNALEQKANLKCTSDLQQLSDCELVIEAVFENLEIKQKLLAEVESRVSKTTIFATNTSALPIHKIASNAKNPERILGMHYFSPVQKMPLLEIVVAEKTAPWVVEKTKQYAIAQGKVPIIVKDGPGFYTTRILAPLLNEAILLLSEGALVEQIDQSMKKMGFPVGPVTLLDEVGIDVGAHVAEDLGKAFAHRWSDGTQASETLQKLVANSYLGRKNGKGFYLYPTEPTQKKKKDPNPEIYSFFSEHPSKQSRFDPSDITNRITLVMVNEAVHCLEEGILPSPTEGDVGAILGLGFPPYLGGPFHYLDQMGISKARSLLEDLAKKYGSRFKPAETLYQMKEKTFYELRVLH